MQPERNCQRPKDYKSCGTLTARVTVRNYKRLTRLDCMGKFSKILNSFSSLKRAFFSPILRQQAQQNFRNLEFRSKILEIRRKILRLCIEKWQFWTKFSSKMPDFWVNMWNLLEFSEKFLSFEKTLSLDRFEFSENRWKKTHRLRFGHWKQFSICWLFEEENWFALSTNLWLTLSRRILPLCLFQ